MEIKHTKGGRALLQAYAKFAEDVSDSIVASLFPKGKTVEEAFADIIKAHETLGRELKALGYKAPERPWKRGVGRIK